MKLLVIGAGGYGRLVREIAETQGYSVDFLDDNSPLAVGKVEEIEEIDDRHDGSIVAIGNPEIKGRTFRRLKKHTTITHPSAAISKSAEIGFGCVIEANAVVSMGAVVPKGMKVESCSVFKKIEMAREIDNESFF